MVSRSDVVTAYRIFLDREPEDEQVIEGYMGLPSTDELFKAFINSEEFRERIPPLRRRENWQPMDLQLASTPQQLQAMIDHVQESWTRLGTDEPYWSVLVAPEYRRESIEQTRDEFYASGEYDLARLSGFAGRCGIDLSSFRTCFELGCGVGRITRWLAGQFEHVQAADISAAHLALARDMLAQTQVNNVSLIHVTGLERLHEIRDYDVFFSVIVLQHNPPPVMAHILRTVLGNLNAGGIGFFQIPTYHLGYSFNPAAYLANLDADRGMEMHVLPQEAVMDIVYGAGCKVLEVREDESTGDADGLSNTFLVQKRSAFGNS